jgi:hypothetical protein
VLVVALVAPTHAGVILTETQAVERTFGGLRTERRRIFLTPAQVAAVEKAARAKLPSAIVTVIEARSAEGALEGRACLDTSVVRTMPATVFTALSADGRLRRALVLHFGEPPDYLPRERWLETLEDKGLDELWPGSGVPRVTGSTLTVQALTAAVRRCLALDAVVLRAEAPAP